jgi:putative ABC transport system permease protein
MGGWGPPIRIARRTARRAPGRTLLVAALIGVPVFAASWISLMSAAGNPTGEAKASSTIGQADAQITVSSMPRLAPWPERPTLDGGQPGPPDGADPSAVRDTSKVDPLEFLPSGSTTARALSEAGSIGLRGPNAETSVRLITGDGQNKLTAGTFKLDSGQMPAKSDEVAVSPSLAKYLGLLDGDKLKPGATLTTAADQQYAVVGLARSFSGPGQATVYAAPNAPLVPSDEHAPIVYLVDLPAGTDADALSDQLLGHGLILLPRANIVHPPPVMSNAAPSDAGATAVVALVVGFGILEIVLLAGTAFAVGARRQTRELGLVAAAGGTARDVQRIVLVQGAVLGLIGAGGAVLLAILVTVAGRPLWERMLSTLFVGNRIPWGTLILIAGLGLLAGLGAAIVPAVSAGRLAPMAALNGRFAAATGKARLRKPAVAMVAAGVLFTVIGSVWMAHALAAMRRTVAEAGEHYRATVTPTEPIALVLLGIASAIIGLIWVLPNLVGKIASVARFLPLSGRLAVRDAARHRHRTGPAAAAIMMSVGATAAMAFAISNSIASEAADYVPESINGDALLQFAGFSQVTSFHSSPVVPYSPATVERVAAALPTKNSYVVSAVSLPGAKASGSYTPALMVATPDRQGAGGYSLMVVDPAYIARLGDYGKQAAAAMRAGDIVVPDPAVVSGGKAVLIEDNLTPGDKGRPHTAVAIPSPPKVAHVSSSALISPDAARELGTLRPYRVQYELKREPTKDELAAVATLLGHEDQVMVEKGYQSPARLWFLGLMGAATVVTLLGVAISVSLSAAEGRADLATLAAVGAPPRRRRSLAAAQAWVLGELGCVLGVGVGALYGYTAHAAFGSPHFVIPWREIGGIVIVVPLFAGLLAWLLTRSRLPMVSRVD